MADSEDISAGRAEAAWPRRLIADAKVALLFATRLPLAHPGSITGADIARSSWALPLAGALIGLFAALIFAAARYVGLSPLVAAALAVAASIAVTGGLHEDGFADTCDGLGGGTRERKLEIMRDSRIGTYGACALILSILLRVGALASLADPAPAAFALIAAHAAARAVLPAFLRLVPPARADGLSADAGRPPAESVWAAALIGFAALLVCLGGKRTFWVLLLLLIAFMVVRRLCLREIGGQTGDTAGALEQAGEILILLVATAGS